MRTADDEGIRMREFDFSRAIRGRFAYLWNEGQREEFLRRATFDDDGNWRAFVRTSLDGATLALFAYLVLVAGQTPSCAAAGAAAMRGGGAVAGLPEVERGLAVLRAGRARTEPPPEAADRRDRLAWRERMGRLTSEAAGVRTALWDEVRRHLAGGGMSPGEIRRRTEAAERLWRAA